MLTPGQRQRRVSQVRTIGVIAGLLLFTLGSDWLLSAKSDPAAQTFDTLLFGLSLIVPGVLLVLPWSRIRPAAVWYFLFSMAVFVFPAGAAEILVVNVWSAIHGAGAAGFTLAGLLLTLWVIQLPAIWSLRPARAPAAGSASAWLHLSLTTVAAVTALYVAPLVGLSAWGAASGVVLLGLVSYVIWNAPPR